MSQEISQTSAKEALAIVRSLRQHLVWQQRQGWSGVPVGNADAWRPAPLASMVAPKQAAPGQVRQQPQEQSAQAQPPGAGADWREKMRSFAQATATPPPPSREPWDDLPPHDEPRHAPTPPPTQQLPAQPPAQPEGPLVIGSIGRVTPVALRPALSLDQEARLFNRLERVNNDIGDCTRCQLHEFRHHILRGTGPSRTRLMLICPQPNDAEDQLGTPFVGASGELLSAMLAAIGVNRDEVFIAYQNKCRTPDGSPPRMEHIHACFPFLIQQIRVIQPELVLAMGAAVAQALLQTTTRLEKLRRQWYPLHEREVLPNARRQCHMLVTYHPFYLLKRPLRKQEAWQDLRKIRERLLALDEGQGEGATP